MKYILAVALGVVVGYLLNNQCSPAKECINTVTFTDTVTHVRYVYDTLTHHQTRTTTKVRTVNDTTTYVSYDTLGKVVLLDTISLVAGLLNRHVTSITNPRILPINVSTPVTIVSPPKTRAIIAGAQLRYMDKPMLSLELGYRKNSVTFAAGYDPFNKVPHLRANFALIEY